MSYTDFKGAAFGSGNSGLTTVGYRLYNPDGSPIAARVTTGITEFSPGTYGSTITFEDDFTGELRWDTGETIPIYVSDFINDGGAITTVAEEVNPYRVVNFRDDVLYGIAHLLGIDPTLDLLLDHARAWCSFINRHTRRAFYFWDWPELLISEERAFRQVWSSQKTYTETGVGGEPDEVYYATNQIYYRVLMSPPVGTVPTDDGYWEPIEALDRFVSFAQPGKQAIGKVVTVNSVDPRTTGYHSPWAYKVSERGIDLPVTAGPTVWITYQVREPKFTVTPYNAGTTYARHDLAYDVASGKVYRCIFSNTGAELTGDSWLEQRMPYIISEYVKFAAAADACDDANLKVDLATQARDALENEADRLIEQGDINFYGPRKDQRMALGLSGFYWSVGAPYLTAP